MRRHRDELPDGHDTRATDAGHQQVVAVAQVADLRIRQAGERLFECIAGIHALARLEFTALDRHEAGAEAVDAGVVLVAGTLVDLPFAPERRFLRDDRQTVRFDRAIAAALADEFIDHDKLVRILELAAFAPPAFFGRTGLRIDEHGDARYVAQLTLNRVELTPV